MLTKEHISQYPHAHLLGIIGGGDGRVAAVLGGAPVIVSAKIHVGGASVTRMEDARPSLSHQTVMVLPVNLHAGVRVLAQPTLQDVDTAGLRLAPGRGPLQNVIVYKMGNQQKYFWSI